MLQRIQPLLTELHGLEGSLGEGATRLAACEAELGALGGRRSELQANLAARTEEAADLKVCRRNLCACG